jgi:predicted dehydrogenase
MNSKKLNRRQFLSTAAIAGAGTMVAGGATLASSCKEKAAATPEYKTVAYLKSLRIPDLSGDVAVDGSEIKVGLVGCGGQGTGDLIKTTKAANGVRIVALGDVFPDKIQYTREQVKEKTGQDVPEENCFVGFDAYLKVIEKVDLVLLVTPPVFRPLHFEAAVAAGKHVFMEKPICVDVVGAQKLYATAKIADTKKLCVGTGTQRRHERYYIEVLKRIADGMIGEITGGEVYWNQNQLWFKNRDKNWSDVEWMIRDWVNWTWLSGDHIVEQHVHNIDVFNWFSGLTPKSAIGFGARHRRVTGDQYDMFSVDFEYTNGVHLHSMCRQINGCDGPVKEVIHGTKGSWTPGEIKDLDGNVLWKYDWDKERATYKQTDPYVLEFVDLINAIRTGKPYNETEGTTTSSLMAVMGRESAYSGKTITWDDIKASNLNLLPDDLKLENLDPARYPALHPEKTPTTHLVAPTPGN